MATKDDIFNGALNLPPEERAELAQRLLDSLDDGGALSETDQRAVDEAWDLELERRVMELREGRVKGIPLAEIRREFAERQKRRRSSG